MSAGTDGSTAQEELCYSSATTLAALVRSRQVSSRELVTAHLERIERYGAAINAFVTLTPERALERAYAADEALAHGEVWGPLHGLPVAHKDLQLTRGVRTTFGSPLFAHFVPDRDSLLVSRMAAAGAVSLGKTNTPEFGAGSQTYNAVAGATATPYDLSRTAGGSSGGAAAALAAGFVSLADGSDMGGSLRNPASFCNVVGLRPAAGRVPSWPVDLEFPLAVEGPMARTVQDCALLLGVIAGHDPRVPGALPGDGSEFARGLDVDRPWRIGWCADPGRLPMDPAVRSVLEGAGRPALERLGEVRDIDPDLTGAEEAFRTWRAWYFAAALGSVLDEHPDQVNDDVRWNIEQGRGLSGADLARAARLKAAVFVAVSGLFERCDVLALPVTQVAAFDLSTPWVREIAGETMHTYLDWMRSAYWISTTGLPALSVPCGFTPDGLPVGLQLVGPPLGEVTLLRFAHRFEQQTKVGARRPPLGDVPGSEVVG